MDISKEEQAAVGTDEPPVEFAIELPKRAFSRYGLHKVVINYIQVAGARADRESRKKK